MSTPWSNQAVDLIILQETVSGFSGLFGYSPSIGAGNLVFSIAAAAGTDPYGNSYPAGISTTAGSSTITGTDYIINSAGAFWYSGTPASGNLIVALANAAGHDTFGNAYSEGITVAKGAIDGGQINSSSVGTGQIANNAITNALMAAAAVGATNIINGAITTTQIAAAAGILGSQLSGSAGITGGQIASTTIQPSNIASLSAGLIGYLGVLNLNPYLTGGDITGWDIGGGSPGNGTLTVTNAPPSGAPYTNALKFVVTSGGGAVITQNPTTHTFGVKVSTQYLVTTWINPSGTSVNLGIDFWNGGSFVSAVTNAITVVANTWQQITTVVTSPSSGITLGSFHLDPGASSTTYTQAMIVLPQVPGSLIQAGTVTATQIQAATITGGLIAGSTITGSNIVANTITAGLIAANAIGVGQLVANLIYAGIVNGTTVEGATLVADGDTGQILVYQGTAASGNLIGAWSGTAGSDAFSNSFIAGLQVGLATNNQVELQPNVNSPFNITTAISGTLEAMLTASTTDTNEKLPGFLGSVLLGTGTATKMATLMSSPLGATGVQAGTAAAIVLETSNDVNPSSDTAVITFGSIVTPDNNTVIFTPIMTLTPYAQVFYTGASGQTTVTKTSGSGNIAIPAGVTSAKCEAWGAGGGGSGGSGHSGGGAGGTAGAGGEYAAEATLTVTGGGNVAYVVGAAGGGTAGGSGDSSNASAGGNSTLNNGLGSGGGAGNGIVTAHGGAGGLGSASFAVSSAGGTGSTNTTHFNGGNGAGQLTGNQFGGGGGGGSGGTGSAGNAGGGGGTTIPGAGGAAAGAVAGGGPGGHGGASELTNGVTGRSPGSGPGGGGGGGGVGANTGSIGGAGAAGVAGQVRVTYSTGVPAVGFSINLATSFSDQFGNTIPAGIGIWSGSSVSIIKGNNSSPALTTAAGGSGAGLAGFMHVGATADFTHFTNTGTSFVQCSKAWSIPANDAQVGTTYRLTVVGNGTQGATQRGLSFETSGGFARTDIQSGLIGPSAAFSFKAVFEITIITTGSGGTCNVSGAGWAGGGTGAGAAASGFSQGAAFNTTTAFTFEIETLWGNTGATMTAFQSFLERMGP